MGVYLFQAKTQDGKFVKGELSANSDQEARIKLRSQKLLPLKVVSKGEKKAGASLSLSLGGDKVTPKDLQIFTRQFSVLISAGVPIVQSLEAMAQGARSVGLTNALDYVRSEVERGKRLADAMAGRPKVFDRMYVNLVKAGEEGGVLEVVLQRLAEYIEKSVKLRGKIVGALWYPAIIIAVSFLVIAGIMIFVIPSFVDMFSDMGQELPALTQMVINASDFFVAYWYAIIGVLVGVPFLVKYYYGTPDGRKTLDEIFIALPLFGSLIQKGSIARMSRTLSTLLSAGVRIIDALEIAGSVSGNWVIERSINEAKDSVSRGKNLVEPMRRQKYFPSMVLQMIAIGEATGNLDTMLSKIADFYEDEVEAAAEGLTSLIEPLLMVFLGGIIAVIVIAMYLPIFSMAGGVQ